MTLIYWNLALPRHISVGSGWLVGLLLDVIRESLLGQHALGLAVVAYLSVTLHPQIRVFPLWQQAIVVAALLALYKALLLWVYGITGQAPGTPAYWTPVVTSAALWPWIFVFMRHIRRRSYLG